MILYGIGHDPVRLAPDGTREISVEESRRLLDEHDRLAKELLDTPLRLTEGSGFPVSAFTAKVRMKLEAGESVSAEEAVPLPHPVDGIADKFGSTARTTCYRGYVCDPKTQRIVYADVPMANYPQDWDKAERRFLEMAAAFKQQRTPAP